MTAPISDDRLAAIVAEDGSGLDSDAYARGWSDCATLVRSTLFEAEPVAQRKWEDAT